MGDISSPDVGEITHNRYKEQKTLRNHGSFLIGSIQGVEKAAFGRLPWHSGIWLPPDSDQMLAVSLAETSGLHGLTSRLQGVIGRDKNGTFFVENMSEYKWENRKGVPITVSAPHLPNPVTLLPKNSSKTETRCPLGGTVAAFDGVKVKWGDRAKGGGLFSLRVEGRKLDPKGKDWEARIYWEIIV
jgi:hypothetical protein